MNIRIAAVVAVVSSTLLGVVPAWGEDGAAPGNDGFASAAVITETPYSATIDMTRATLEEGEPSGTCAPARGTVWFSFTPKEDLNVVAEASGVFKSAVTVFRGPGLAELGQVGCDGGTTNPKVEFKALAGQANFVQVAVAGRKRGLLDFSFTPTAWQERTIKEIHQPIVVPEQKVDALTIDAGPRADDPNMYDITVTVAGQRVTRGILSFGLLDKRIHQELLTVPGQATGITIVLSYRYDSSQYYCLTDGGPGQQCTAKSPIKDLNWLTSGEGSRAELLITTKATLNDSTLAERTVTLPFAGQVAGMP